MFLEGVKGAHPLCRSPTHVVSLLLSGRKLRECLYNFTLSLYFGDFFLVNAFRYLQSLCRKERNQIHVSITDPTEAFVIPGFEQFAEST